MGPRVRESLPVCKFTSALTAPEASATLLHSVAHTSQRHGGTIPRLTTFFITELLVLASLRQIACAQPNPDKITLGTITLSLNKLPIYVAQDKGLFANENIFL